MGKKYEVEKRYYISIFQKKEDGKIDFDGVMNYVSWNVEYGLTYEFINAQHFSAFEDAKDVAIQFKRDDVAVVIGSLIVTVNGFDIGELV